MSQFRVSCSSLNQMPLAWQSNLDNVMSSVRQAIKDGCHFRPGVEFELCGVFCGVHLHDTDFNDRVWWSLLHLLDSGLTDVLPVEVGSAFKHEGQIYNCLITLFRGKVLFFRAAVVVAMDGGHPSNRFVSPWASKPRPHYVPIPPSASGFNNGGKKIPIGNYCLDIEGVRVYSLFPAEVDSDIFSKAINVRPDLVSIGYSDVFELGRIDRFLQSLGRHTDKTTFLVNAIAGSDSPKTVFEGGSWVVGPGHVGLLNENLSLKKNQHAVLSLTVIREARRKQESSLWTHVSIKLSRDDPSVSHHPHTNGDEASHRPRDGNEGGALRPTLHRSEGPSAYKKDSEEEALLKAMSAYLFHTLLETKACGFFLALSGGADSSLELSTVFYLADRIARAGQPVKDLAKSIIGSDTLDYSSAKALTGALIYTAYLPMKFSGRTYPLAKELTAKAGCEFLKLPIEDIYRSFKDVVETKLDVHADFSRKDGSPTTENLALQSLQARIRLTLSYLAAQLLHKKYPLRSYLLTLATGNLSEVVRGYFTKYDNSSGDINLLGSLPKTQILALLRHLAQKWPDWTVLQDIASQPPTAELIPPEKSEGAQTDEGDMGFTYEQIDFLFHKVRIENLWGDNLVAAHAERFPGQNASEVVGKFLHHFQRNRHKTLTLPPSVHLTRLDLDGQFDVRPSVYKESGLLNKRAAST